MIGQGREEAGITRRALLGGAAGASAAAALLPGRAGTQAAAVETTGGFRFVHLTDIHVQPELKGGEGLRKCLEAVHTLKPRPDFILTGGDQIMDALECSFERVKSLFALYRSIKKGSDIPFRECIGNHDIFGWGPKNKASPEHALYGRKMAQEGLGLERTSYSFDHKGCHFCCVDDIRQNPEGGYDAQVNQDVLHWLDGDLASAGQRPKVICTHIPILTVTDFRNMDAKDVNICLSGADMCRNAGPVLALLRKHRVPLVLTGHQHELETIHYDGTTHIDDGSVCGAWWKGPYNGTPEGFGIIDLRADGTFEHRYQTFGWKAEPTA